LKDRQLKDELEEFILNYTQTGVPNTAARKVTTLKEYTDYTRYVKDLKAANTPKFQRILNKEISVKNFWVNNEADFPNLSKLAIYIFSLVCASASAERNFSMMAFIHSKLRNREQINVYSLIVINHHAVLNTFNVDMTEFIAEALEEDLMDEEKDNLIRTAIMTSNRKLVSNQKAMRMTMKIPLMSNN